MTSFTPQEIVAELDRHIIGQQAAKRSVAIALRNRWRRQKLPPELREEVMPKNILMIGSTGVGKTEISRRLAKIAEAPFIKVEATKFTEVGYVGRDVEQIIRDLVEISLHQTKEKQSQIVRGKAEILARERVLDALVGDAAGDETREKFLQLLLDGKMAEKEIEIEVNEPNNSSMPTFDVPGMPGAQMGMVSFSDLLGKAFDRKKKKTMKVKDSYEILIQQEMDKLLEHENITMEAIKNVEENAIVFLDEIDKIARSDRISSNDVSREGVQRDLLPLIEGTTVSTKHGAVRTDHILFIASGAFHVAKPSDLLPELQGRLPIRVELKSLSQEDFVRILTEPEANLITQYKALMYTEGVDLSFTQGAIEEIAKLAVEVNRNVENIGARRLQTVIEKLLEEISFSASERAGTSTEITQQFVRDTVGELAKDADLSKFIL